MAETSVDGERGTSGVKCCGSDELDKETADRKGNVGYFGNREVS